MRVIETLRSLLGNIFKNKSFFFSFEKMFLNYLQELNSVWEFQYKKQFSSLAPSRYCTLVV